MKRTKYLLLGGPYNKCFYFGYGGQSTLTFSVGGHIGYYDRLGVWHGVAL